MGGTFLVVQWFRFYLPLQGMQIQSLVGKLDPTCLMAKTPKHKTKAICNKFNKDFKKWSTF